MIADLKPYTEFLEAKIVAAEVFGVELAEDLLSPLLMPHQRDIVRWCIQGGRRAIFASFGLGKTVMQLELARQVMIITGKPFLICLPLGVVGEFKRDNEFLNTALEMGITCQYITDTDSFQKDPEFEAQATHFAANRIYLTNYERVRMGDIDPDNFGGVSFDEASILRNLQTETTNFVLTHFRKVPYRFVATATPTPNDFIEIVNYADYLGVIDRGHALTRFFQRDSQKAGHLKLYENKKEEFWKWVSTWAVFINKPSDLGYDDAGYILPRLHIHEVEVDNTPTGVIKNRRGEIVLLKEETGQLSDDAKEKASSVDKRVEAAWNIFNQHSSERFVLWSDLESERLAIEKRFKAFDMRSVYGSQPNAVKEDLLIGFSNGEYQILNTKSRIAGSGCNFQHYCHMAIYVGITHKFNDFIQSVHRLLRFKQQHEVHIWVIFTNHERKIWNSIQRKWRQHIELNEEMINLVRTYGLNSDKVKSDMKRQVFTKRRSAVIGSAEVFNEDTVAVHNEMPDNSTGMILTSIPFGDHYDYSDNYNDFGHNDGNENFFKQMDYLTPNLLRTLKPGRIAAIHVKDRIRYSYQNGTSFTKISDFSGQTVMHFEKHGFHLVGKITVTTDVVRENNQTYRLGWSEQLKDATTKGVGLPEYVLLFRKAPSHSDNSYADDPVCKKIDDYLLSLWQLDAHAYWKSSGDRLLSSEEISHMDMKGLMAWWKKYDQHNIYDFQKHLQVSQDLDNAGKLSKLFMTLPPNSNSDLVWTDINRMNTLNANQTNRKKEKHICPLQLDIIKRLIYRFTNKQDKVDDPFGGLFSTPYIALQLERGAISAELNPDYYDDGLFYLKSIEYKINVPTLFDLAS